MPDSNNEVTNVTPAVPEVTSEEKPKEEKSILSIISDKVKSFVSGKEEPVAEEIELPESFVDAATKVGWTNDEIMDFVKNEDGSPRYSDQELLEMISYLSDSSAVDESTTPEPPKETPKAESEKKKDSQEDERLQKIQERLDALEKERKQFEEEKAQKGLSEMVTSAMSIMDESKIDALGTFDTLPKFPDGRFVPNSPQMKARNEIWDVAYSLNKAGMDFKQAMSVSLNAFKGKNLEQDVKRNLIKDLKKNEKKLSAKHSSHETVGSPKSGIDVIKEVARRHGREIPD